MHDLFKHLADWYMNSLDSGGYLLIALLMAVESSIVPLPSELIIPPAAYLAYSKGNMSMLGIILAGTVGSWIGATAMYWASRWAGRPLVLRYGKYVFIPEDKVLKSEQWASRFGSFGIFASRLLPVVRHLIGIPAGIVRMHYGKFSLYTVIGSALWCGVLCWLGVKAGQDEALMKGELHRITLWAVGILGVLGLVYYFLVYRFMKPEQAQASKKA